MRGFAPGPASSQEREEIKALRKEVDELRRANTQTLADHGVLASLGSVGDAYDNAGRELRRQLQDRAS